MTLENLAQGKEILTIQDSPFPSTSCPQSAISAPEIAQISHVPVESFPHSVLRSSSCEESPHDIWVHTSMSTESGLSRTMHDANDWLGDLENNFAMSRDVWKKCTPKASAYSNNYRVVPMPSSRTDTLRGHLLKGHHHYQAFLGWRDATRER